MSSLLRTIRQFLAELRRRNVYQVAVAYLAAGFVVVELANIAAGAFDLPGWFQPMVWVVVGLGFPIALVMAWALEVTPEGVRIEETMAEETDNSEAVPNPATATPGLWVGASVLAVLLLGTWWLIGDPPLGSSSPAEGEADPTTEERSVAVLPFEALSPGSDSRTFAQGIHGDLITRLSNVSDLLVTSGESVERYRETQLPLPMIADTLGARWIVDGEVQQVGNQIQVRAQLIDPENDANVWAENYQRTFTAENFFAIQGDITQKIVDALETTLTADEKVRIARAPTQNLQAYRLYVKGRRQLAGRTFGLRVGWRISEERGALGPSKDVRRAVGYFREAIEQDSSFALAWAGLADAAAWYPSGVPDSAAAGTISQHAAAQRALTLDPDLAEAHASMGFVHLANRNAPAALRELKQAVKLKPSYWEAHHWLGEVYLKIGRAQQALDHLTLALELNPQHAIARHWLYDTYLAAGQPTKSLQEARQQQQLGLEQVNAVAGEIRALYHLGRLEEARRLAQEQISRLDEEISNPRKGLWPIAMRGHLVAVLAAAGDTTGAREQLEWLRSAGTGPFWIGFAHAAVGETDRALAAWERMNDEAWGRIPAPHHLRYGIMLDLTLLRDDPRYRELIRKANRAWDLNPDGTIPEVSESATTAGLESDV